MAFGYMDRIGIFHAQEKRIQPYTGPGQLETNASYHEFRAL